MPVGLEIRITEGVLVQLAQQGAGEAQLLGDLAELFAAHIVTPFCADEGRKAPPVGGIGLDNSETVVHSGNDYVLLPYLGISRVGGFRLIVVFLPQQVFDLFDDEYINVMEPYWVLSFAETILSEGESEVTAVITDKRVDKTLTGRGNGLLAGFVAAFSDYTGIKFSIENYSQHAMKSGSDSAAISYIEIKAEGKDKIYLGAGVSSSVTKSSVRAIVSAFNRMMAESQTAL